MFKTRLVSGIVLMAITILLIVAGGNYLFAAILMISLIGMWELYKVVNIQWSLLGFVGYIATICYYTMLLFEKSEYVMALIVMFLLALMVAYVIEFPKYSTAQLATGFMALVYVSVMLSYIYQVRMVENGMLLVWLIFIGAWGSDTCAYCVGVLIGKHKIAPKLSPKKSLEGCIGGVVGAALIGVIYAYFVGDQITNVNNPTVAFALIGAASSVISQVGDLTASAIKRNHDIKDYGNLIPGHGGILDRFDSIIFVAPIVFYLITML